jgi:hypothetical protein
VWHFALVDSVTAEPINDLHDALDRKISFKLNGATEVSFTLPGRADSAAALRELTTDVYVAWDVWPYARCRVGATTDTLDENDHRIDVGALDYLALLDRRYVSLGGGTRTDDLTGLAWWLIDRTQAQYTWPGGDFGIRRGLTATTASVTVTWEDGKKIGEAISDLHDLHPGFDYEIDAALRFNVWAGRGTQRDFALEYGGNVARVTRAVDPERYCNLIRYSGADGVDWQRRYAPDLASRPEGRIETQEGNTDLANATLVGWAADAYLQRHGTITPAYQVTLAPDVWTPDKLWLGDMAWLRIDSGRLDVIALERVFQITVTLGNDGQTDVELGFGDFQEDLLALVRAVPARLEQINRR